jgi:hypothetical protein
MEEDISNNSSIVACVFVAAVPFLQSRCLATIGECTYRHTDRWEGFMQLAVQMGSDDMLYISSFIKTGSAIQILIGEIHTHTDNMMMA